MSGTTDDDEPAAGIRASDAERDATIERLSAAAGDGRLTLEEFSQRMELATAARTRAELDRLVTDLPADVAPAATAAASAPAPASWHVTPVGGLRVRGPWRMDPHVIVVSIVGGVRIYRSGLPPDSRGDRRADRRGRRRRWELSTGSGARSCLHGADSHFGRLDGRRGFRGQGR